MGRINYISCSKFPFPNHNELKLHSSPSEKECVGVCENKQKCLKCRG